ncbi:MAG TPA: tetratricopeptide repeat protein [Thermoanaerobaculia bacterium]|jgi:tetratricopeptide (TPR) repeat protein
MVRHRARSFTRRAAAALLLVCAALSSAGCNKIKSKQEIKKGNDFFKAAQYQTALAAYQDALRLDPNEKKLHKNIGLAYMGLYQPGSKHPKDLEYAAKAIEHLKIYSEAFPADRKSREFLVSLYLTTERYDDAIAFYQAMVKENPNDTKAMQSLAQMYFKKGDVEHAVEWLKKRLAVETTPEAKAEVYYFIGVQAWDRSYNFPNIDPVERARIVDEGIDALNKALQIKPDYFEAISYLNLLYREKAKIEVDPAKKQEYVDTANRYLQQALELRKKVLATKPTPEPAR